MLAYSVHIPCDRSAAPAVLARVTAAARHFGVADPVSHLGDVLTRTFARPPTDPAYRTNCLQPGELPLEWSFSEADPDALRIELQPFDPDLAPEQRLRRALAVLLPLVSSHHGPALAAQFAAAVGNCDLSHAGGQFGAFLGVVVRPRAAPQFKLYVELDPEAKHPQCRDGPNIPGVVPHFRSVAVGRGVVAERAYFLCGDGLRLLDLESLCNALGMPDRFPALLVTVLGLTDGEFYLPPRSALLGIRRTRTVAELKVELVSGIAISPDGLAGRVARLLAPAAVVPFRRWLKIVHVDNVRKLPVSIVSVRATATQPPRLSVYAAEPVGK